MSPSFTFVPSVYTAILSLGDISLSKSRTLDPVRPHASWPARSPSDLAPPRSGLAVAPATPPSRVFMPARLCPEHRSPRWVRAGPSLRPSQHGSPVPRSRAERRLARPHSSCPRPCSTLSRRAFIFFLARPVIVYFILPFLPTEYKPHEGTEFFSEVPSYSPNAQNGIWCQTQKESKGFARNK